MSCDIATTKKFLRSSSEYEAKRKSSSEDSNRAMAWYFSEAEEAGVSILGVELFPDLKVY